MPATYDLTIYNGATFSQQFIWRDSAGALVNLTGFSARMQIRANKAATTFIHELTNLNGGIALGGAAGTINLTIPATTTAGFTAKKGVYDLELVSGGGVVTRLVEGAVVFSPEVTR